MRIYVDSSALIKRVVSEPDADVLRHALAGHADEGDVLVSSSLAWIEVSRALRSRISDLNESDLTGSDLTRSNLTRSNEDQVSQWEADALSGILEKPISGEVIALARRVKPWVLRSLGAVHVASALLIDADLVIAYDERLIRAARANGLATNTPS